MKPSASTLRLLLAAWLCFGFMAARAQVIVNEFVAENGASATDEDGDHPDWIELLNTTSADVSLDGWWLSDEPAVPMKWRIPAATLAGRGYLVVFASGKNRANPAAVLHTNFQIGRASCRERVYSSV